MFSLFIYILMMKTQAMVILLNKVSNGAIEKTVYKEIFRLSDIW